MDDYPEDDDLATYAAAKLADAAVPIVEDWQAHKRGDGYTGPYEMPYVPSGAQLDALERALTDLLSLLHPDV